jgi:protein ImuA
VAAAVAWPRQLDGRTFRRWQLAAEEGGCLGLLLRPEAARNGPSWADVRLWVEPLLRQVVGGDSSRRWTELSSKRPLRIVLLRCRGGTDGRGVEVELDDETYRMHPLEERRLQMAN